MQRVTEKFGKKAITIAEYEEHGKFASSVIIKRFGGWNKAKESAGLKIGRFYNSSEEDFFENILNVWQALGRQPKYREMETPLSKFHISSYERRFGTWRSALEGFIEYVNTRDDTAQPTPEVVKESTDTTVISVATKPSLFCFFTPRTS